eukprot:c3965_g1_i4.p2 GENE.c3965_g1_i4~~c3965_g1_i4.p2  ORF type:complete len:137 (+),score=15.34 c3965_g1_i4:378-788(+)
MHFAQFRISSSPSFSLKSSLLTIMLTMPIALAMNVPVVLLQAIGVSQYAAVPVVIASLFFLPQILVPAYTTHRADTSLVVMCALWHIFMITAPTWAPASSPVPHDCWLLVCCLALWCLSFHLTQTPTLKANCLKCS